MNVLVDTCVWAQVLRRDPPQTELTNQLTELITDNRVSLIGPIRQEILSGISNDARFNELKDKLSAFEDIPLKSEYFIKAAGFSNLCRINGIQGSATDFLICSVAYCLEMFIFTLDNDFKVYKNYLPIKLFE
ncbi:MAG: PIN domain-containing protein [Candidatus Schekmanbacteria bacterium]|nr:PIN domain-containing protein [Candidatus Schekmanbacteria bacterium]